MRLRPLLRRVHERVGEPKIERYLYFETPTIEGLLKLANCMDETHVYCISVYQSNVGRSIGMLPRMSAGQRTDGKGFLGKVGTVGLQKNRTNTP